MFINNYFFVLNKDIIQVLGGVFLDTHYPVEDSIYKRINGIVKVSILNNIFRIRDGFLGKRI